MKCPNCDANNGKTNKYCRACGTRLEVLASREPEQDLADARVDEVAFGEALFAVHELLESGDLDAALEKSEELSDDNPGSASAHAITALVYERKAEQELTDGDASRGRDFLKRAIERYENIIDLNPDSAADRGKLASLRMKYTGHAVGRVEPPATRASAPGVEECAESIEQSAKTGVGQRRGVYCFAHPGDRADRSIRQQEAWCSFLSARSAAQVDGDGDTTDLDSVRRP